MSKPRVSVLMSVHNGERHLSESIESILNQTFDDFEFIIVDDCSTDDSLDIAKGFSNRDPRIQLILNNHRKGLTKSLLRAFSSSAGEYIARQDADDISLSDRLRQQLIFLDSHKMYGAVGTSARIIDDSGDFLRNAYVPKTWFMTKRMLRFGNCFLHGSMMFRKEAYLNAGGYRSSFALGQDFDLWLRISKRHKMKNLDQILYCWRETGDNSMAAAKTGPQLKTAALALYDHRYDRRLKLDRSFEINSFIDNLAREERKKFDACLRNICLRHGNIALAKKYLEHNALNMVLIFLADAAFRVRRINRTYSEQ